MARQPRKSAPALRTFELILTVRYEDPRTASPKRDRLEQRLGVAFNNAVVTASFLNYIDTKEGRKLVLGPIRRFRYDDAVANGLAVKVGDIVHVGYPYKDKADAVKWITASFKVESHPFLDVMDAGYAEPLTKSFVGEKIHLRLIDRGLDRSADRDTATVTLKATSGATTSYELQETEAHSGIFKSSFAISYAPDKLPAKLPPVALNGLPVRYTAMMWKFPTPPATNPNLTRSPSTRARMVSLSRSASISPEMK